VRCACLVIACGVPGAASFPPVKPPPPVALRNGALVRVAGGPHARDVEASAHSFLDLRFPDGHVERWLGPGYTGTVDTTPAGIARLQAWAREAASEFAFDIACDVARNYSVPRPPPVDDLPCDEVVVEWNSPPPTL
jgi:hypothetical protein